MEAVVRVRTRGGYKAAKTASGEEISYHGRKNVRFRFDDDSEGTVLFDVLKVAKPVLSVGLLNNRGMTATFAPDGPERCSGLPVRRWSSDDLAARLAPGFRRLHAVEDRHTTPGGAAQAFQYTVLERV